MPPYGKGILSLQALRRKPRRVVSRWALALTLSGWFASSAESSAEGQPASADARKTAAVLIGSSSFNQDFGHIIAGELARRGYAVTRKGVSGAGLARPDYRDMTQELEALPIGAQT